MKKWSKDLFKNSFKIRRCDNLSDNGSVFKTCGVGNIPNKKPQVGVLRFDDCEYDGGFQPMDV